MFDIGWIEMALVAVIALFVFGPNELPHVLYKIAGYWRKLRVVVRNFQGEVSDVIRQAELDELRNSLTDSPSGITDFIDRNVNASTSDGEAVASSATTQSGADLPASGIAEPEKRPHREHMT